MIAIVFLLVMLAIAIFAASQGAAALPIGEIMMLVGLFLVFFGSGVYIAVVLGALALLSGFIFSDRPFWLFLGQVIWAPSSSFVLVAVPLFLLMGEILLRSGLSEQLYRALNVWMRRWPGGLLHTNIAACAVFSAISGSSVATAATMGSVALPYFEKKAYRPAHGAGLAGRRRRARQLDTARHHLHCLRAHDRDIGRQDVYRRYRSERARLPVVFRRHLHPWPAHAEQGKACHRSPRRKDGEASSTLCRRRF